MSCGKEVNIDNKLNNHLKITGNINNICRPKKTLNKTRIKLYNILFLTALLHGSENWTIKARGARITRAAEIIHMIKIPGYTWTDLKQTQRLQKELI